MMRCSFVDAWDQEPCHEIPIALNYCRKHIGFAPEENAAVSTLTAKIASAQQALNDVAEAILAGYVMPIEPKTIPDDLRRDYRNLWYRLNYLKSVRNGRRPGDPLPAEVTKS